MMNIAILEAGHWHVPLYLDALARSGGQVAGVSDREGKRGPAIAARFGCRFYESWRQLLERETIDFAFAFGRHVDMPSIASALIARRIPFAIEKPCGTCAADVATLRRMAEEAGLYVAIPFIMRVGDLVRRIAGAEGGLPARFHHAALRFNAGPASRYIDFDCPWMLDPKLSGGGCTINLATHFVDLLRLLTGSEVVSVAAQMTSRVQGTPVEEHSLLLLKTADGTTATVETGYTFPAGAPEKREFSFTLSSGRNYYRSHPAGLVVVERSGGATREVAAELDTDPCYALFVERALADFEAGRPPVAGLRDAEAMMRVLDAAYESVRSGGRLVEVAPA